MKKSPYIPKWASSTPDGLGYCKNAPGIQKERTRLRVRSFFYNIRLYKLIGRVTILIVEEKVHSKHGPFFIEWASIGAFIE
ncbi:hypothetical protein JCM16163A_36220 [Paenibacillus sp. YK5]|nr:hypothetical protein PN4B1_07980 [Paenibacillus naphthalenovorans]